MNTSTPIMLAPNTNPPNNIAQPVAKQNGSATADALCSPTTILPDPVQYRQVQKAASRLRQFALDVHDVLASWVTARDGCPPVWSDETTVVPSEILRRLHSALLDQAQTDGHKPGTAPNTGTNNTPNKDQTRLKQEGARGMCKQLTDLHRLCHDQLNLKQTDLGQMQQQLHNALAQIEETRRQEQSQCDCDQTSAQGDSEEPLDTSLTALQMWQTRTQRLEERVLRLQQEHANERVQWQQTCDRLTAQVAATSTQLEQCQRDQGRLSLSLDEANRHVHQLHQINQQQAHALQTAKRVASQLSPVTLSPPSVSLRQSTKESLPQPVSAQNESCHQQVASAVSDQGKGQGLDWSAAPSIPIRPPQSNVRRLLPLSRRFNKDSKARVSANPSVVAAPAETYGTCERRDLSKEIVTMVEAIYELMEKDAVLFGDADKVKDFELMLYHFQKKVRDLLRTNDADSPSCVTTPEDTDDDGWSTRETQTSTKAAKAVRSASNKQQT